MAPTEETKPPYDRQDDNPKTLPHNICPIYLHELLTGNDPHYM